MNESDRSLAILRQLSDRASPTASAGSPASQNDPEKSASINSGDAPEKWFFRIDGHDYGPATRAQLEYLLTPPRLCSTLQVMCTEKEGYWATIGPRDTLGEVLSQYGIVVEEPADPVIAPAEPNRLLGQIQLAREGVSNWLSRYARTIFTLLGIVGLVASLNGIALYLSQDPLLRDREVLARYELIWQSVVSFDQGATSPNEWRDFSEGALADLEPIVQELSRTANVHRPVRQNLLYLGREDLPKLLKLEQPPSLGANESRSVQRRLKLAKDQMGKENGATTFLIRRDASVGRNYSTIT